MGRNVPGFVSYERENSCMKTGSNNLSWLAMSCHLLTVSIDEFHETIIWEYMIGIALFAGPRNDTLFSLSILTMYPASEECLEKFSLPIVDVFPIAKNRFQTL